MNTNSRNKVRRLGACFLILGCQFVQSQVQAADSVGVAVFDVRTVKSEYKAIGDKEVGVFGEVLVGGPSLLVIQDYADAHEFIEIDMGSMPPRERQRLTSQCRDSPCFEIVVGSLVRGRLKASGSFSFKVKHRSLEPVSSSIPDIGDQQSKVPRESASYDRSTVCNRAERVAGEQERT